MLISHLIIAEMFALAYVTNTTIVSVLVNGVETTTYSRAGAAACEGEPYCDCMCELPSSAQIFGNHLIVASFEVKRYEQTHLKSVMCLTIETDATRCMRQNCTWKCQEYSQGKTARVIEEGLIDTAVPG